MKKSISILSFLLVCLSILAVPAKPEVLRALLEQGDTARYNEMINHERLVHNYTLQTAAQSAARRVANGVEAEPEINLAPRGLLILVNFADVQFREANTQAEMSEMLNGENYTYGKAYGSARQYFRDQSNGAYDPQFDVVGPVTLPENMAYYGENRVDDNGNSQGDAMAGDMVLHACSLACEIPGVDFSLYDNDNDGVLDFVYVIYAGYNEAEGGSANTIWPASWDIFSAAWSGCTSLNGYTLWEDQTPIMFGGKMLYKFAFSSELRGRSGGKRAGIGTFCHEFSHVLGLPDYYDTSYGTNYSNQLTPGAWSLMDAGSYNKDGEVPPSYSIYDKWFMGWATPTLLNEKQHVTLSPDSLAGYYINEKGTTGTPTSTTTTYYLENRQQTGWDQGLPGHGLLVWQVKYKQDSWIYDNLNNKANSPRLTIINAKSGRVQSIGGADDPFPGTANVDHFAPFPHYPLTHISESNGVVDFDFMYDGDPDFKYTLTVVSADSTKGTVTGSGEYAYGDVATMEAIPAQGYMFIKWSDGFTRNPRTVNMTQNREFIAYFEAIPEPEGLTNTGATRDNYKFVRDGRVYIVCGDRVYDVLGQIVK